MNSGLSITAIGPRPASLAERVDVARQAGDELRRAGGADHQGPVVRDVRDDLGQAGANRPRLPFLSALTVPTATNVRLEARRQSLCIRREPQAPVREVRLHQLPQGRLVEWNLSGEQRPKAVLLPLDPDDFVAPRGCPCRRDETDVALTDNGDLQA